MTFRLQTFEDAPLFRLGARVVVSALWSEVCARGATVVSTAYSVSDEVEIRVDGEKRSRWFMVDELEPEVIG